jgi:hypothetical protein
LAEAVCGLSTVAPLKARSDKLSKVNFSKWLCHRTFMSILLSQRKLQDDSAHTLSCRLKGKSGIISTFFFIHGMATSLHSSNKIQKRRSEYNSTNSTNKHLKWWNVIVGISSNDPFICKIIQFILFPLEIFLFIHAFIHLFQLGLNNLDLF